jgi:hypothetical protein
LSLSVRTMTLDVTYCINSSFNVQASVTKESSSCLVGEGERGTKVISI